MLRVFFFNDPASTEIYTLSLHDALPICLRTSLSDCSSPSPARTPSSTSRPAPISETVSPSTVTDALVTRRSEEHTSELQSRQYLVCRLLLEKTTRRNVTEIAITHVSNHF